MTGRVRDLQLGKRNVATMKSTSLGTACVMIGVLVWAGDCSAGEDAAPARTLRARAGVETAEETAPFWQHVADYCGREDADALDPKVWDPLLDPKVVVQAVPGTLR